MAEHAIGSIQRYGTILKDTQSGRIVGHLQETSALHTLIRATGGVPNPISSLVGMASNLGANVQLYRLDNKVEALRAMMGGLHTMQMASLALAGIGIGISALGFAAVKLRLDQVSMKMDRLEEIIRAGFDAQRASRLREYEAKLSGGLDNAEEGWHARDGGRGKWTHVADALGEIENFYAGEIGASTRDGAAPESLAYLLDRYRVCVATKLECYVLLDEPEQGHAYAEKARERSRSLFDRVTPLTLAGSFSKVSNNITTPLNGLDAARAICVGIREMQDMHATAPFLLRRVGSLGVSGRDYVQRLKSEEQEPLLILRPDGSTA